MPDPATPSTDAPTPKPPTSFRQCRSLTVRGRQCQANAMHGHQFCIAHSQHRFPVCPQRGTKIAIPLLEDLDTIQVVATQVAHGLFSETLDPWRAGKILYALQVAALTIPRPAPLKPSDEKPVVNEPVTQAFPDLDGHLLGPDLPWKGNDRAFNPVWNYHRRLYVQECERLGNPIPTTPEDFPAEGWLTKEEMNEFDPKSPELTSDDFLNRILLMRLDEDRRGKLPPLYKRECSYGSDSCKGPWNMGRHHGPCNWCEKERAERILTHPEEDAEIVSFASELETSLDEYGLKRRMRGDLPRFDRNVKPPAVAATPATQPAKPAGPLNLNAVAEEPRLPQHCPRRPARKQDTDALKGHGFSRAAGAAASARLQPVRGVFDAPPGSSPEPLTRVNLDNLINPMIPKPYPPSTHPGGRGPHPSRPPLPAQPDPPSRSTELIRIDLPSRPMHG